MPRDDSPEAGYRIVEERSGAAFDCAADDVLLRAALRAGQPFAYECNVGGCGSCKFELLDGTVADQWPQAPGLGPRDRQRGRHLACQSRPLADCRIRMIGRGVPEDVPAPRRQDAVLVARTDLTHDMALFHLRGAGPAAFRPGQYALLGLPQVAGPRAYSMANLANAEGDWEFIVRRVPGGAMTEALFDLAPGGALALDGPYGHAFLRPGSERPVVCIAGGSGLSPMIGIARGLEAEAGAALPRLDFFYGGRTADDICGEAMLRALPRLGPQLRFHACVSTDDPRWQGRIGMIHELLADLSAEAFAEADFYLAGPPAMAEAVVALLGKGRGVPAERIRYDRFF
ncbi:MAG: FAD-binding oxidoreductase [Reyranellaceae bacterium]